MFGGEWRRDELLVDGPILLQSGFDAFKWQYMFLSTMIEIMIGSRILSFHFCEIWLKTAFWFFLCSEVFHPLLKLVAHVEHQLINFAFIWGALRGAFGLKIDFFISFFEIRKIPEGIGI